MWIAQTLVFAGAFIILVLGSVHLLYTFRGSKLHPRDADLIARMRETSPVLTRETTIWKAWIGFNASHGFGAMLFGATYGYLAVAQSALLFSSTYLQALGLAMLIGYLALARAYWFSIPRRGIALAAVLYVAALLVNWA